MDEHAETYGALLALAARWKRGEIAGHAAYAEATDGLGLDTAWLASMCEGSEPGFDATADALIQACAAGDLQETARRVRELHDFLDEMQSWLRAEANAQNSGGR